MQMFTKEQERRLTRQWDGYERGKSIEPLVKLFTPDASATWWIAAIKPGDPELMYGMADLGLGVAEWGLIPRSDLESLTGALGLPVERDRYWKPGDRYPGGDTGGN